MKRTRTKREKKEPREIDIRIANLKNRRKIAEAFGRIKEEEQINKELEKCIKK